MRHLTKSSLTLVSILLLSTCLTTGSSLSTNDAGELTSTLEDGQWVNNTLVVNGTTTFEPQNAKWILFDIDDLYGEWSVLRSGEFFSEVSSFIEPSDGSNAHLPLQLHLEFDGTAKLVMFIS